MASIRPPDGTRIHIDVELCREQVVHQKPQPSSAQCYRPITHSVRPATSLGTEQGLLPCAMGERTEGVIEPFPTSNADGYSFLFVCTYVVEKVSEPRGDNVVRLGFCMHVRALISCHAGIWA